MSFLFISSSLPFEVTSSQKSLNLGAWLSDCHVKHYDPHLLSGGGAPGHAPSSPLFFGLSSRRAKKGVRAPGPRGAARCSAPCTYSSAWTLAITCSKKDR